jgi:hypothetical protein
VRRELFRYLRARRIDNLDQLDAEVRRVSEGETLEHWKTTRKK